MVGIFSVEKAVFIFHPRKSFFHQKTVLAYFLGGNERIGIGKLHRYRTYLTRFSRTFFHLNASFVYEFDKKIKQKLIISIFLS